MYWHTLKSFLTQIVGHNIGSLFGEEEEEQPLGSIRLTASILNPGSQENTVSGIHTSHRRLYLHIDVRPASCQQIRIVEEY